MFSSAILAKRNEEQSEILDKAAEYVKPGGRLLYATCSFLAEEDEDQVSALLERNTAFRQLDAVQSVIESGQLTEAGVNMVRLNQIPGGAVRLTPNKAGTDGFFFAVLQKSS